MSAAPAMSRSTLATRPSSAAGVQSLSARDGSTLEAVAYRELPIPPHFARERIGEVCIDLAPGDLVFIGTDGLFEAPRAGDYHLGQFGADRVADLLLSSDRLSLQTLKARVLEALEAFTEGTYDDDVAFLMLRARAEAAA